MANDKSKPVQDEPQDGQELNLAEAIKKISEGMDRLLRSGLNRKAVVVLLAADTKVAKKDIEKVLTGLTDLSRKYAQ